MSRISKELDSRVEGFKSRSLNGSSYCHVWVDALHIKVREEGHTVRAAVGVATAVNGAGRREIIGLDIFNTEDGASWTQFFRELVARGLSGVVLLISDCHLGLRGAIEAVFSGASWQRYQTHMARKVLTQAPRHAQDMVTTFLLSVFPQPDADAVHARFDRIITQLEGANFTKAAHILAKPKADLLTFAASPKQHWCQIWPNNPWQRLNKKIRRRTDVAWFFSNREAVIRLVGSGLAGQYDEG